MLVVPLWFIISSGNNCISTGSTSITTSPCSIIGPYISKDECEKNNLNGMVELYIDKDNKVHDKEDTLGTCKQLNKAVMYDPEYSKYCDKCDKDSN